MRALVAAALIAVGCGGVAPNYDGDYDVRISTIDATRCTGEMYLGAAPASDGGADAGAGGWWSCGDTSGTATLDVVDGEVYLTLETAPRMYSQVRSKPGAFIAGPIILDGQTFAFVATRR